ncbi:hypothetical protein COEREDRAFT_79213 [Coemansia reversa NRRL 1564]|uniref:Uncharacterized protein n=1 Tax=Coemansia reversa (strain ATCC 12441 / NRRL 1564) TaxID=763665 RepID=A0A2G5BJS3_COERN|nr:hypothetical protein COEREDRAFT_79213 [Coemansia reversa NRRL 1564]|eukprot:PIA19258.1 hypothetical protein COEREDRAFT_79213 [Coemansia reversa NRRL 1564]
MSHIVQPNVGTTIATTSQHLELTSSIRSSVEVPGCPTTHFETLHPSSTSCRNGGGFGGRIWESFSRAIAFEAPPAYTRGAWAIINDVPYPAPPPYAGSSRHPPTYEEALEIGVVASPLRVEQRMRCQGRISSMAFAASSAIACLPRVESAPQLTALPETANRSSEGSSNTNVQNELEDTFLPGVLDEEFLPKYDDVDDTIALSPIVRRWHLGEPAFEKPAMHPKGYKYSSASN